jgi:hypothetical protein
MSSRILGSRIPKDERLSNWSSSILTVEQAAYAAIDAWASLAIYNKVKAMPEIGARIRANICLPGLFVSVKPRGFRQAVASGQITNFDSVHRKCLVKILRVNVPGYLAKNESNPDTSLIPLSSFGDPPFELTVSKEDLVTEAEWLGLLKELKLLLPNPRQELKQRQS